MSSKNVRQMLSTKDDEKFSIVSLDSTFFPSFFNVVDNDAKNFSAKFESFFRHSGDVLSKQQRPFRMGLKAKQ